MKKALFLGGSKGLGLEMAKLAVNEDRKVTIAARSVLECELYKRTVGGVTAMPIDLEAQPILPITHLGPYDLIVWTAGAYQEGSLLDLNAEDVDRMVANHVAGPAKFLLPNLRKNRELKTPVQLVVVASSTSYRVRMGEGLYGTVKAAKAQFARTLGKELPETVPGSKVMLAHPGGMRTPFWDGRGRDTSTFMDPAAVAKLIWDAMKAQKASFDEIHVDRQPDGSASLARGVRPPQF
jgi:NAD(P)-dependent dehydrogenase (short-subunit alcohol dehydrogenase family)